MVGHGMSCGVEIKTKIAPHSLRLLRWFGFICSRASKTHSEAELSLKLIGFMDCVTISV
jgi:hypothetical protein